MMSKDSIERKLESKMTEKFNSASDNPKLAIHLAAAAGAVICAVLPIGLDAWALRTCEVIMIICIASLYEERLTKSAARGVLASSFAQLVGETAALAALEAANTANLLTPFVAYGIKASIAVGLIETIGHEALKHYDAKHNASNKRKITAFDAMCAIGGVADAARIANATGAVISEKPSNSYENANLLSFCGDKISREIHEFERKIKNQESNIRMIKNWIESDIRFGRDTTRNKNKLKYALAELERLNKELSRLAAK